MKRKILDEYRDENGKLHALELIEAASGVRIFQCDPCGYWVVSRKLEYPERVFYRTLATARRIAARSKQP